MRADNELTLGERAADRQRNGMGSWTFVGLALVSFAGWMIGTRHVGSDPYSFILLDLVLSFLAAMQGAVLPIAARRSEQVAARRPHDDTDCDAVAAIARVERLTTEIHAALAMSPGTRREDGSILDVGTIRLMEAARRITPGRFRRLTEELVEEDLGVVERSSMPAVLVDEIDYAMRPPRHERRTPSYGSLVLPDRPVEAWREATGLEVVTSSTADDFDDAVRRYADGLTSWTVRTANGVDSMVVFDRAAGSERDLVVLASATGAMVVQRHPNGEVRLVGSFGVARWDGLGWHTEPPVDSWLKWATCGIDQLDTRALDQLLRFAVHDLGSQGIGALLVFRPGGAGVAAFERRLSEPPPLRIDHPTDLAPLRHVLTQTDGAALFDASGRLVALGVLLMPTPTSEASVDALGGTRHTSARRYSFDDPDAVVVAVSEDGPVTVFRRGEVIGRSRTD